MMLQKIYEKWTPPTPAFKANHEGIPEGMIPYISYSDVHDYNYNIRVIPLDIFLSKDDDQYEKMENGKIIAHYETMEELVRGWLDIGSSLNLKYC